MKRFFGKKLISHEGINLMTGSNEIRLQTEDGVKIALFNYAGHCQSAAHAINNHDALVEALKSARHMLWAAKNNMQNDGSPESLELAVMIAKEDLRELDKLIEKFEGES